MSRSGSKTGRSPKDKRVRRTPRTVPPIFGGATSIFRSTEQSFIINRQRAIDYLNIRTQIYVVDGYAGWDPQVPAQDPHHLRPAISCACSCTTCSSGPRPQELAHFGQPDYVIYNAGQFPANPLHAGT